MNLVYLNLLILNKEKLKEKMMRRGICYFSPRVYTTTRTFVKDAKPDVIDFYAVPRSSRNIIITKKMMVSVIDNLSQPQYLQANMPEKCSLCESEIDSKCTRCYGRKWVNSNTRGRAQCPECVGVGYIRNKYCGHCYTTVI